MKSTISLSYSSIGENSPFSYATSQLEGKTGPKKSQILGSPSLAEWGFARKSTARRETSSLGQHHLSANKQLIRKFWVVLDSPHPATMVKASWESEQA
jgi:hypothetical protein